MSMAIIGVAGTVIGAGASIYSSSQQSKAAKTAGGKTGGNPTKGLPLGQKPVAAEYRPVDFDREQWNTVQGNLSNLGSIADLMRQTNSAIDGDAMRRAVKFVPGYKENMRLQGEASTNLLSGRLPYDDVMDIVANRGELTGAMGVPGTGTSATLRDLGLSRLDAIKSGSGLMKGMVDIAETVNPVGRRMRPQDMFLNPLDRIRMAMSQNETIQQSDQNRNNIEAAQTPEEAVRSQVLLAQRTGAMGGGGGGGGGADIGGYAQAAQGLLSGIGSLVGNRGGGGGGGPSGTYGGQFAVNPSEGVKNRIYRPYTSSDIVRPASIRV